MASQGKTVSPHFPVPPLHLYTSSSRSKRLPLWGSPLLAISSTPPSLCEDIIVSLLLHLPTPRSDVVLGDVNIHTNYSILCPFPSVFSLPGTQISSSLTATLDSKQAPPKLNENILLWHHKLHSHQLSAIVTPSPDSLSSLNVWVLQSHSPSTLFQATSPSMLHHCTLKISLNILVLQISLANIFNTLEHYLSTAPMWQKINAIFTILFHFFNLGYNMVYLSYICLIC